MNKNTIIEGIAVTVVQEELLQAQTVFYATHEAIITALKVTGIPEEKAREIVSMAVEKNSPYIADLYARSMKSKAETLAEMAIAESDRLFGDF